MSGDTLFRLELIVPSLDAAEVFAPAIERFCFAVSASAISDGGPWRLEGLTQGMPASADLIGAVALAARQAGLPEPEIACSPLPEIDWAAESQRSFQPFRVGRFHVRPSHAELRPPPGSWPILVDAGMAFGTGEHATTRGCLLALDDLARRMRVRRTLDMGCGSGILAIGMARAWPAARHVAVDVDPQAVAVARENLRLNQVAERVCAEIGATPPRAGGEGFDLIAANILATPLARMARALAARLAPGGALVLSGLLVSQEALVLAACRRHGLHLSGRRRIQGWSTLLLRRP